MENCIFCKIIEGKIPSVKIWEDEEFYAFLDANPLNPGHLLIVPREHIDYLFDLHNEKYMKLFVEAKKLQGPLKSATNAKRIGLIVEGFEIPHAHLHLLPLHHSNDLDPSRAKKGIPEEMEKIAEKIRLEISKANKKQ